LFGGYLLLLPAGYGILGASPLPMKLSDFRLAPGKMISASFGLISM
jgi:hypothetical protein